MEWPFSRVRKIFFRGRNFQENPGISGSQMKKRARKNEIPYPQPFHNPTRLPFSNVLPQVIVLELIMRYSSASCHVETPRLGGFGVKYDAKNSHVGDLKISSTSTEGQKRSQNLAPVLAIISGNSLVFSRKMITSTGFYWCCALGASAPVVLKNQSPIMGINFRRGNSKKCPTKSGQVRPRQGQESAISGRRLH